MASFIKIRIQQGADHWQCAPLLQPLILGLTGVGAGLYFAKEYGYLDGVLGAPPTAKKVCELLGLADLGTHH